jgi:hypothetical protein
MVQIGVDDILYRIQDDPFLKNVKKSDVVNYIKTVLYLIGAPTLYEDKVVTLQIYDYKAQIPKDFVARTSVRLIYEDGNRLVLQHNTDDYYNTYKEMSDTTTVDLLYTHKIVGDTLWVDFEEGKVELAYKAVSVDENGWPMFDANESLILAIEWYIKQRYYRILWTHGKLPDKVADYAEQQYNWYMGQATARIQIQDPIEAEATKRAVIRMIPLTDSVATAHKYDSQREYLKTERSRRW